MTAPGRDDIPEDLRRRYEHSKNWLERNREQHPLLRMTPEAHDNFIRIELIERISALTRENRELREAAGWLVRNCTADLYSPWDTALKMARAALAKKEAV